MSVLSISTDSNTLPAESLIQDRYTIHSTPQEEKPGLISVSLRSSYTQKIKSSGLYKDEKDFHAKTRKEVLIPIPGPDFVISMLDHPRFTEAILSLLPAVQKQILATYTQKYPGQQSIPATAFSPSEVVEAMLLAGADSILSAESLGRIFDSYIYNWVFAIQTEKNQPDDVAEKACAYFKGLFCKLAVKRGKQSNPYAQSEQAQVKKMISVIQDDEIRTVCEDRLDTILGLVSEVPEVWSL